MVHACVITISFHTLHLLNLIEYSNLFHAYTSIWLHTQVYLAHRESFKYLNSSHSNMVLKRYQFFYEITAIYQHMSNAHFCTSEKTTHWHNIIFKHKTMSDTGVTKPQAIDNNFFLSPTEILVSTA